MKTLIRWIAGLYPRSWRVRYGQEYLALLEDLNPGPRTALNVFGAAMAMQIKNFGFAWIAGISLVIAAAAFAALFAAVPPEYRSQGTLKADSTQSIVVRNQWLTGIVERVESRSSLTPIIESQNLYPAERQRMPLEDVLDLMRRNLRISSVAGRGTVEAVLIDFHYSEPQHAQRAMTVILSRMVEENLGSANPGVTVSTLDPASLSIKTLNHSALGATMAAVPAGLLTLGGLLVWRRRALRKA
jgi:hypothetical protein